jgi:cyclophilin family peptidyl-prolyl cis-trans isomerase
LNQPHRSAQPVFERLEERQLLAATPVRVTQFYTDNRGQTEVFFTQALNTATLTKKSVRVFTAGTDGQFGTADDRAVARSVGYKKGRLVINANLPANTRYRVRLAGVRGINGLLLDGEFNGMGRGSGNGPAGGNWDIVTKNAAKTRARFTTLAGPINIALYTKQAPRTAGNFTKYANDGSWDTTFFHRSIPGFIVQGGGFNVNAANEPGQVTSKGNVQNEFKVSNTRGTIAMARAVDGNPATTADQNTASNQWFFNLNNNNAGNLDNQEGGFTVFGVVTDSASLKVMDAIAKFARVNAGAPFDDMPVRNLDAVVEREEIDWRADPIHVSRVAMMMDAAATPVAGVSQAMAVQPASRTHTVVRQETSTAVGAFSTVSVPVPPTAADQISRGVLDDADKEVFAT